MKKASRNEIKLGKALRSLKRYTAEDWKKFSHDSNAKGETPEKAKERIAADTRSIYYWHPANKYKDIWKRKNWMKRHQPELA